MTQKTSRGSTLAFAGAVGSAATAWALPPLTPHDHATPGIVTWQSVANPAFNPNTDAHQHWKNQNLFNEPTKFKTYSAWDNNSYRYDDVRDRPRLKSHAMNPDPADYGHGYMERNAQYWVRNNVGMPGQAFPAGGQADFGGAFFTWHGNVNQVGALNSNNLPVRSQINFTNLGAGPNINPNPGVLFPGADLEIRFDTRYLTGGSQAPTPQDFPTESELDGLGRWGGNPNGGIGGGIDGTLAWWTPSLKILTFNANVNWYFSAGNANDLDPTVAAGRFDFFTVALHEIGHAIGLDHTMYPAGANQAQSNTTMFGGGLPRRGGLLQGGIQYNGIRRGLDGDTIDGARGLYTIPAPAALVVIGSGMALATRRKRGTAALP